MSKAIYIKDGNKMREIPEMEEPRREQFELTIRGETGWVSEGLRGLYFKRLQEYNDKLFNCKEYPCPPQHSFVEGVTYEEGKDYEIHHYNHGGFGKPDDYKATAIPINKESEDEIISELLDGIEKRGDCDSLHKKGVYDFIKQSFSISRKQK